MTQDQALAILKTGRNVFLTGAAGSGKTHVLNRYIAHLREHDVGVAVTASTGIAATHMNGVTIHSWSGLGVRDRATRRELTEIAQRADVRRRLFTARVLIIDEVSMLHATRLDLLDELLQVAYNNDRPFGGLQVVLAGDFFQLPPVADGPTTDTPFAFAARAWHEANIAVCYLAEQHRQEDDVLLDILNQMRAGRVDEAARARLRAAQETVFDFEITPTRLFPHNASVDTINRGELESLPGATKLYRMQQKGPARLVEALVKSCLAPEELRLKVGAAVMFVKNNWERGYVNGTLGTIDAFDEDGLPVVQTFAGQRITALPERWMIEEDGVPKAGIVQVPLRLAWAITVHKSQGMSLDAAEIDLSHSFEPGMGYVALSRVRRLEGLKLHGFNDTALTVNADVMSMDAQLQAASRKAAEALAAMDADALRKEHEEYLLRVVPSTAEKKERTEKAVRKVKGKTYDVTKELLAAKKDIAAIAAERGLHESTIIGHLEKLLARGDTLDVEHIAFDKGKLDEIEEGLQAASHASLGVVFHAFEGRYGYDELRLARVLLRARGVVE